MKSQFSYLVEFLPGFVEGRIYSMTFCERIIKNNHPCRRVVVEESSGGRRGVIGESSTGCRGQGRTSGGQEGSRGVICRGGYPEGA